MPALGPSREPLSKPAWPTPCHPKIIVKKSKNTRTPKPAPQQQARSTPVAPTVSLSRIQQVNPDKLTPHPVNLEIYGDQPGADLIASVREHGVLQPLLVTPKNVIIAGHMRHAASLKAERSKVPVITVEPPDRNTEIDMLLAANRQRVKTNEQIAREVTWLMKVEQAKARGRQATAGGKKVPAISPEAVGDARKIVAEKFGIGGKKVDQCVKVIEKLDQLKKEGADAEVEFLGVLLKKSVNKAENRVAVLDERKKLHATEAPAPAAEIPTVETKADVITRLQEDLVDGIERWPLEKIIRFEKALAEFKSRWEIQIVEEAA
jgi:ParB/RepB/Spo0J family partition protein